MLRETADSTKGATALAAVPFVAARVRCVNLVADDGTNAASGLLQARATRSIQSPDRSSPSSAESEEPAQVQVQLTARVLAPAAVLPLAAESFEGLWPGPGLGPPTGVEGGRPAPT